MLIKCPECGHQVSDKAPLCPNCGVEIAGNVSVCSQCGTNHISGTECPACGLKETDGEEEPVVIATPIVEKREVIAEPIAESQDDIEENEFEETSAEHSERESTQKEKGSGTSTLMVSLLIAALICGVGLYFYKDAADRMESEQTVGAVGEDTATVAPVEDIQPIVKDTVVASKPDVVEKTEEEDVLQDDESDEKEAPAKESTEITDSEKEKAVGGVRRFLRAINSRSKDALLASIASTLSSFNGKNNATKTDIVQYMIDTYQADVKELTWRIDEVVHVKKNNNSNGKAEYEVVLHATREVSREGGDSKHRFNINAVVDGNGQITSANITRK